MDDSKGLSYFLLGMGIGCAVGILFAPKSGEETRGALKQKANEGKDYLVNMSGNLKDQANDYVEKGKQAVSRQKEQLTAAVEAGKQAYRETVGGPYDRAVGSETNY